jgi:HD-GYP domain-containing protein (c-di-GMP phosphodiesterase class II)
MYTTIPAGKKRKLASFPFSNQLALESDSERRTIFLRYVNYGWLALGIISIVTLPLFPSERTQFLWLVGMTIPTFIVVHFLNAAGRTRWAGMVLTLVADLGFYGLFLVLTRQLGAMAAFDTQSTIWLLMGLAVVFAGAFVDKWAAPAVAVGNLILLIATRLTLAPAAPPRPSALAFWAVLALTIWLYEGTLSSALERLGLALTDRQQAERELQRLAKSNAVLYELSQKILVGSDLNRMYDEIRQSVQQLLPCEAFVIALSDEVHQEVEDVYLWDRGRSWPGDRHPIGTGLTSYIISTGKPLLVNEWNRANAVKTSSVMFGSNSQSASVLAIPLLHTSGRCFGMLSAQSYIQNAYVPAHEQVLTTLANQVAKAIENAQHLHNLRSSNQELIEAYEATIEGWSRAMDLRDKETEGHTRRVTQLTLNMVRFLGFREDELVHVRRGALLHDVGKLGVPDRILHKADRLTKREWELMRRHPTYSFEMLSPIKYLEPALDIPFCHHERWDGTGYPRGLKGDQIPRVARIFAVVDVWDALTNDRPYRPAWSHEQALQYLKDQAGKHFDPEVVAAFVSLTTSGRVQA